MTYNNCGTVVLTFLVSWIYLASGQFTLSGCPQNWVLNQAICYKFVANRPSIYEEADSHCWSFGAKLLTINDYSEHRFIADWLIKNDVVFHSTWFTSGMFVDGQLVWGDESSVLSETFWISPPNPSPIFSRVSYQYKPATPSEYGWKVTAPSHPSNFICEIPQVDSLPIDMATRDFGYGVGFLDPQILPHGPIMLTEPIGIVVFGTGRTIYLECDSHGLPQAEFVWLRGKNDERIEAGLNKRYTLSGGRLTIQSPEENEDGGFYKCYTFNQYGGIYSTTVQIIFGYLHAFPPVKPENQAGTEFEGVRISCLQPAYNPAAKFSWFKNHDTHNMVFDGHPYHFVSQSGYLYFSEVQFTDDRTYYCVVTLDNPDYMVADSSLAPSVVSLGCKLQIKPGKNYGNYGPIIHTHVFPSPALRGSSIRLECIAFGSLPLSYKWHREDGRPFAKGTRIYGRNRVLNIPHAELEDEGNYICTVTRPGASATAKIVLVLETKPYFADHIKDVLADPGQKVTWHCKAVARPKAVYSWYKDGQLLKNMQGKMEIQGNILTLYNVDKAADEGMYQCAATNQHGTSYSSSQLKVITIAPNFVRFPMVSSVLGPIGGNRTIDCHVEGAPLPIVRWLKGGRDMNLVPGILDGRIGMTIKNSLVITYIEYSDQALYTCEASNDLGKTANSTFMTVVKGIVIARAPQSNSVLVNRTEFMYCAASYDNLNMDITYEWLFNGHPIHNGGHYVMGEQNGVSGLYIREAQYVNRGEYTCTARSTLHSDSKSAFLEVQGPPGPPAGVYVDAATVTTTSVQLIWTIGSETDHGVPILYYDLEAETNFNPGVWEVLATDIPEPMTLADATSLNYRTDQRTAMLTGLTPHTSYRFRVRAVNDLGRGQEASRPSSAVKTPASIPVKAPSDVGGGDGSVGTLEITWTPLPRSQHCGTGIGYRIYWKKLGNPDRDWQQDMVSKNIGRYTALVGEDNYYLQYEVIVQSYNSLGDGPNSTITTVYSAMGLPVAVPTITGYNGVNGSTCVIYFTPVPDDREHMKGRVSGYTIEYYWNKDGCNPMQRTDCPKKYISRRNVWGQSSEVTLINMVLNAEYFFRMLVLTRPVMGPEGSGGEGKQQVTVSDLKLLVNGSPLDYPLYVSVTSVDKHSIRVRWRQIQTTVNEEIITGYKVKVWMIQADIRNANETTCHRSKQEVIVRGLQTRTVYQLRVQGTSAGGDGQMSESVFFSIEGGVLPVDPSTTQICFETQPCASSTYKLQTSLSFTFSLTFLLLSSFLTLF